MFPCILYFQRCHCAELFVFQQNVTISMPEFFFFGLHWSGLKPSYVGEEGKLCAVLSYKHIGHARDNYLLSWCAIGFQIDLSC